MDSSRQAEGVEWRGREWSEGEGRGGKGRAGQGRVPDCLGGLSRVGISSRSTRPWNGQPPSSYYVCFVGTLLKVIKEFHGLLSVWHLESGVCEHTFKHKHAISAIALSTKLCISGCDSGIVTVWDVKSGQVVKVGNELNQDGSPPSLL